MHAQFEGGNLQIEGAEPFCEIGFHHVEKLKEYFKYCSSIYIIYNFNLYFNLYNICVCGGGGGGMLFAEVACMETLQGIELDESSFDV
jgi:hypothetical protein